MRAFIINLDSAKDRWDFISSAFSRTSIPVERISAVPGDALHVPHASYSERLYRWFHGRTTNRRELGCYFSHVKALEAFLETDDEYALICEDDLVLKDQFECVTREALRHHQHWNILRLTGLRTARSAQVAQLSKYHSLRISFTRIKGAGAYIVDRKAAEAFIQRLLPMRLPIDHAIDREWRYGLRAAFVLPFPVSQTESRFRTSIQLGGARKLSWPQRCSTTFPYQAFNEVERWLHRTGNFAQAMASLAFSKVLRICRPAHE